MFNIILGRYHRPREERRVFLFVDLVDSTRLAGRLGDLGVQRLLSRFFFDAAAPVLENGGEIHAYVGDELIVTWPYSSGIKGARCVSCFFDIQAVLKANEKTYIERFGELPRIRAGLHGGSIIVSECGDLKSDIVFFGNTMNVTSRLEETAKKLRKDIVISAELLQALTLPEHIDAEPLGNITLRGQNEPTPLYALSEK